MDGVKIMSKFRIELSMKDIKILKHSLEKRIENDEDVYQALKKLNPKQLTEEGVRFIKDHEEHMNCLKKLIDEIKRTGNKHGVNVFGSKYQ